MSMRYGSVELSVPPGFQNILWLLSQEVLRVNPEKPLEFIAGFMDDLLAIREASGYDPVTQGDMMSRVQEQYWRVQQERQNSKNGSEAVAVKRPYHSQPNDEAGDNNKELATDNADVLATLAMHQHQGEGTGTSADKQDEVAMQQETCSKQLESEPTEEEDIEGDTIQKEGTELGEPGQDADKVEDNGNEDSDQNAEDEG
ncbi:uncharacterized protein LOC117301303 [Asterias rubens]|uniref:uncharacterized protein LOC117301303 n=1 Tax=Asterias rubens TaxID=7604 RepID=UPI0014555D66|nr:uncharacterized protein LOC117301303 [Asterias rubens]